MIARFSGRVAKAQAGRSELLPAKRMRHASGHPVSGEKKKGWRESTDRRCFRSTGTYTGAEDEYYESRVLHADLVSRYALFDRLQGTALATRSFRYMRHASDQWRTIFLTIMISYCSLKTSDGPGGRALHTSTSLSSGFFCLSSVHFDRSDACITEGCPFPSWFFRIRCERAYDRREPQWDVSTYWRHHHGTGTRRSDPCDPRLVTYLELALLN